MREKEKLWVDKGRISVVRFLLQIGLTFNFLVRRLRGPILDGPKQISLMLLSDFQGVLSNSLWILAGCLKSPLDVGCLWTPLAGGLKENCCMNNLRYVLFVILPLCLLYFL